MKRLALKGFGLFVVAAIAAVAVYIHAGPPRVDATWLAVRALSRESSVDYTARVVSVLDYSGKRIRTLATVFHTRREERIEYRASGDQPAYSVTRGAKSYTLIPGQKKLLISEASRLLSPKESARLLARNFRAECVGIGKVAGRKAFIVDLVPRGRSHPAKKLWIDQRYFTILRSTDYSSSGALRGRFRIIRISYGAKISPAEFELPPSSAVKRVTLCRSADSAGLFKSVGFPVNRPKFVPVGYRLEGYHLFNCQCGCGGVSALFTYTDGLNVVSVFENPLRMRCCVYCSGIASTAEVTRKNKSVVVVGDLPANDLGRMAESVN